MQTSEQINELAAALAKAQGQMGGAAKSAANPFFKSKYADLASVVEACRAALTENGIAIVQSPTADGPRVSLETWLIHSSGQYMAGTVTATAKDDGPQAVGSTITYLRRYALQSFAGVAPEDDDAEAAQGRGKNGASVAQMPPTAPKGFDKWLLDIEATVDNGIEALRDAWKVSDPTFRDHLMATSAAKWEAMKAKAAKKSEQKVAS